MRAIVLRHHGGPEALTSETVDTPEPKPGEVLVRVEAAGVNFIDTYQRSGLYKIALPYTPGLEGAGTVEALGPGVEELAVGARVAWASSAGSYAELAAVPAEKLVLVPHGVSTEAAAAAMLQGMTAHYLAFSVCPLEPGDAVLVHAAAGGTGRLLVQMLKARDVRVLGTVSSEAKAALAKEAGADETILYTEADFVAETRRLTNGAGVAAVFDSVGRTTFEGSLGVLRLRGYLVLFGASSGPVPPLDPQVLNAKGSLFLTRPSLFHYTATRAELLERAGAVLGMVERGELALRIDAAVPLADAAEAHRRLEGRATTGKLLLVP